MGEPVFTTTTGFLERRASACIPDEMRPLNRNGNDEDYWHNVPMIEPPNVSDTPQRAMWRGLLGQSLLDCCEIAWGTPLSEELRRSSESTRSYLDSPGWVASDEDAVGSFTWVCDVLGYSADYIRGKLMRTVKACTKERIKAGRSVPAMPGKKPGKPQDGELNTSSRLNDEKVRVIRKIPTTKSGLPGGRTTRSIAAEYNVSETTISHARSGKTWKHVK